MTQLETHQPSKTFRGTVEEVFSHRSEIPAGATVELKVFENGSNLFEEVPAASPPKQLRGLGAFKGKLGGTKALFQQKQEEIQREERRF